MIEYLESLDIAIVQLVNGWNTPFLDEVMWIVSGRLTWVPLYILLVYLAAFGLGTGNFGTGIRHRTKFVILLILLAAPWLPNFVFNKKKPNFHKKKL